MFSLRLLNISRSGPLKGAVLLLKYRSVPWDLLLRGAGPGGQSEEQEKIKNRLCEYAGGGQILKRLIYAIPLSAIAVLVFAAIAVAQDVPTGQEEGQEPSPPATDPNIATETNSTSLQKRITSSPATKEPAESSAPAPNSTTTVDINYDVFNPAQLSIAPGTAVKFENKDTVAHTATADNDVFDTNRLESGESMEVYFEGAGTVTYHDNLHPDMKGNIVVGADVGEEGAAPQGEDTASQKGTAEEAPNTEPISEADQPATEAAPPLKG